MGAESLDSLRAREFRVNRDQAENPIWQSFEDLASSFPPHKGKVSYEHDVCAQKSDLREAGIEDVLITSLWGIEGSEEWMGLKINFVFCPEFRYASARIESSQAGTSLFTHVGGFSNRFETSVFSLSPELKQDPEDAEPYQGKPIEDPWYVADAKRFLNQHSTVWREDGREVPSLGDPVKISFDSSIIFSVLRFIKAKTNPKSQMNEVLREGHSVTV